MNLPLTTAWEEYRLTAKLDPTSPKSSQLLEFLLWGVRHQRPGLQVGDKVGVRQLSDVCGYSRTVAGQAVAQLAKEGLLRTRDNALSEICSTTPIITADESISLSESPIPSESYFSKLLPVASSPWTKEFSAEIARAETRIATRKQHLLAADGLVYLRVRLRPDLPDKQTYLYEATLLQLENPQRRLFRSSYDRILSEKIRKVSLFQILEEQCMMKNIMCGRTEINTGAVPPRVIEEFRGIPDARSMNLEPISNPGLLKWTYGFFHPGESPCFGFSICFVDTTSIRVLSRAMDFSDRINEL